MRVPPSAPRAKRPRTRDVPEQLPAEPVSFSPEAIADVEEFAGTQPFPLDPYQIEAARHLADGRSVLVAAPTGTGKTVVAEMGIWQAHRAGKRAIYTAPLKALSNQKFRDLRGRYGEAEVGLLTGDIVENARAPIVVMTTEIYRNMLLEGLRAAQVTPEEEAEARRALLHEREQRGDRGGSDDQSVAADDVAELARRAALDEELSTVGCVIFDELHYLSNPERGPVWEEAIIHSPEHVTLIGLSATVSNADELRQWIERVHGPIALVFHDERAVPLEHYFYLDGELRLAMNADGRRVERFPDIGGEAKLARMRNRARRFDYGADEEEPPHMVDILRRDNALARDEAPRERLAHMPRASAEEERPKERLAPEAGEILTALRKAGLLPCIYFLPGRRAVETAAESAKGHLLVSPEDRERLHNEVQEWISRLPAEDQKLEQVRRLGALLPRGLAFHHAGLLPGLKMMVETLFQRGELRAVFATDTLALGINMPARSVVLGSLSKFDGTQMRLLTPNEYQQLTGRAGRRGMDAKGAAVLPYSPWDAFEPSFAALTAPLQPVTSAFSVRYNTVLNLWTPGDQRRLRLALAASFREFQRRSARFGVRVSTVARAPYGHAETFGRTARKARQARARDEERLLSPAAAAELTGTITVLRWLGYIGQDDELSVKGRLLRAMFHPAGMVLTELLMSGALADLASSEIAEVVSWFTFDDDRNLRNFDVLSQRLTQVRREVYAAQRRVLEAEYDQGLTLSPGIVDGFHGVALNWSRGFSLGGLLRRIDLAEGDLLVILNQTIDLLQQLQGAVGQTLDSRDLWRLAKPETRQARYLAEVRERLERLRPTLDTAWRGMLRGSVAQSRAIPAMVMPAPDLAEQALPTLPMVEDEEPDAIGLDRVDGAED
ncbi:MAG TPA: DEAD/DEAH box helicase [Ktedonobacterales bacterium]|nr:DEAD/DEAH box helicase [Ktedonobacterales bacterium]